VRVRGASPHARPHWIGVDDGPFEKRASPNAPIVGVVMEGGDLVEGVAITRFPVDGDGSTGFLADWISGLRFARGLHGVVLGGITIAGLGVVDVPLLSERLGLPVVVVNRRDPRAHRLDQALRAAGLADRIPIVERTPPALALDARLFVAAAGMEAERAIEWVHANRRKSLLPEPLRIAHLIAAALASGQSRGRA
jgi:hypothetical protein